MKGMLLSQFMAWSPNISLALLKAVHSAAVVMIGQPNLYCVLEMNTLAEGRVWQFCVQQPKRYVLNKKIGRNVCS